MLQSKNKGHLSFNLEEINTVVAEGNLTKLKITGRKIASIHHNPNGANEKISLSWLDVWRRSDGSVGK